ncbi:MAG: agmatine deiminase family protein [Prevotellaceae bacterium]|nr:agmatine deiminase family protein [Prevotellaceae bacterium]MDY6130417.1 agmatine deiminase family protein [Prevotella sp.]
MNKETRLPAEWEPQSFVQLTWPHKQTDWLPYLDEINTVYVEMACAITKYERLLVVCPDANEVKKRLFPILSEEQKGRVVFHLCPSNDTWARDHGFITLNNGHLLDFRFNGWGEKFAADKDNAINGSLFQAYGVLKGEKNRSDSNENGRGANLFGGYDKYENHLDFVLEGGSIESDGQGTVFTTTGCLLAPHRNQPLTQQEIENELKKRLCAERVLWIDHGHLAGDDTDGHIDTLVRLAPNDTLLYVGCDDEDDEHFADLKAMESQLRTFRTKSGAPYHLLRLPMPDAVYAGGERLPATYANFLIINGAVIIPAVQQPEKDKEATEIIRQAFPDREMILINSLPIVRQHGSIHCCTMQFPIIK